MNATRNVGSWGTLGVLLASLTFVCACRPSGFIEVPVDMDGGKVVIVPPAPADGVLRVTVAAIQTPSEGFAAYSRLVGRLGAELGRPTRLVHRRSYRTANDALLSGATDVAFICTGGYYALGEARSSVEVIAVPVVNGAMTYQSYILVPADSPVTSFQHLAGKRFAFTDELSLSGHAYPRYVARTLAPQGAGFFGATLFTQSHDRSVEAVANRLVDGAAVDGRVYEAMLQRSPQLAQTTRIILKSPPFGAPPIAVPRRLPEVERSRLKHALLGMNLSEQGREILAELAIERYAEPPPELFREAFTVLEGATR